MNGAEIIPELTAEIEALKPFADLAAACDAMNGRNGAGGLRKRYVQRLYNARVSDPLVHSIGHEIDRLCSREIALLSPIQDREHDGGRGWSSMPLDYLTDEERSQL